MSYPFTRMALATLVAMSLLGFAKTASSEDFPPPLKPGKEHEVLKEMEGTWDAVTKLADGTTSKGVMTYKMECGGLWLVSHFKADFGGHPFEGRGMDSYDTDKKKYVGVWVDSMVTTPMIFEGEMDKDAKSCVMTADGKGPGGKKLKFKSETTVTDKDHHTFKMSTIGDDDKENLMMTIEYARQK